MAWFARVHNCLRSLITARPRPSAARVTGARGASPLHHCRGRPDKERSDAAARVCSRCAADLLHRDLPCTVCNGRWTLADYRLGRRRSFATRRSGFESLGHPKSTGVRSCRWEPNGSRHTYASQYIRVDGTQPFVLASDNAYLFRNINNREPSATFSPADRNANIAALDRMIQLAGSPTRVVPGHDATVFKAGQRVVVIK